MRKKCYENPLVEIFGILEDSVLLVSGGIGGDALDTYFKYDDSPWS